MSPAAPVALTTVLGDVGFSPFSDPVLWVVAAAVIGVIVVAVAAWAVLRAVRRERLVKGPRADQTVSPGPAGAGVAAATPGEAGPGPEPAPAQAPPEPPRPPAQDAADQ